MVKRMMIMGRSGSGKSTFAYELIKKLIFLYITWINIFLRIIGNRRNYLEFIAIQQELVNKEQWIIDGN